MAINNNQMPADWEAQPNEVYLELIRQILDNNERAFFKLYTFISPVLYSVCMKFTKNEHDANDVFQIAMANLYFKLKTFNDSGLFIGWARKLFTNNCIDYLRKRKREDFEELPDAQESEPPAAIKESDLNEKELLKILQKLPVNYRIHITLYFIEDYKQAEIAEILGTTEAAVKATLHRAKLYLAKFIIGEGGMD